MPAITVETIPGKTEEEKEELARHITEILCGELALEPRQVAVFFRDIEKDHLAVGGMLASRR